MKSIVRPSGLSAFALAAFAASAMPAFAQDAADAAVEEEPGQEIIVTGVVRATNRLDSSISVSAVKLEAIENSAPKGLSEIFRQVPGVRSESSAGGGNSNIGVRGIPISTGGAKFVQLQEDGLPIMLFGDFEFAPADGFYKADVTLDRVEAVRGGSASTLTVNGPGAIINLISKAKQDGGSFTLLGGIDHRDFRIDADVGTRLSDDTTLYVGGHYQVGGDYRRVDYDAVRGGQIKVSLHKEIGDSGSIRLWAKHLDKRDATYLPQAHAVDSGLNVTGGVPGLGSGSTIYGPNNRFYKVVNSRRQVLNRDLADGFYTRSTSFGANLDLDLASNITLTNNFRYADISGDFLGHFTHNVAEADRRSTGSFGGAAFRFANGDAKGQLVTSASLLARNGNPFVTEVANFDVELEDMGNIANDFRLGWNSEGANNISVTGGLFFMQQQMVQDWHWDRFLTETSTNAALIDVAGFTENGILGYNQGFGWDGNNRHYDLEYSVLSPYAAVSAEFGNLTLDASVRHDTLKQDGVVTTAVGGPFDVDGDGVIDPPEAGVSLNTGTAQRNDFKVDHLGYSVGLNYRVASDLSLFARYSKGASFNGERQAFSGAVNGTTGALLLEDQFVDRVKQLELGVKYATSQWGVYATFFDARTEESNTSVTAGVPAAIDVRYKSRGVETEFFARLGMFRFDGSVTYTDATVTDFGNPAIIGNRPRRQAKWVYAFNPTIDFAPLQIGASVVGTSKSFGGFNNVTVQPAYVTVGAFVNFDVTDNIRLSLLANNLFNEEGVTEVEDDQERVFDTNADGRPDIAVARGIGRRTISARLGFKF